MISVAHLSYKFPGQSEPALKDFSCRIEKGQSWAIVGPDGAGKTTLLRLLVGVLKPMSGTGYILGHSLEKPFPSEFFQDVGYLPQKLGLYEDLSISQQIQLYARLHGCDEMKIQPWVEQLLTLTLLKPFPDRLTSNLSGGMRQKLALICALLHQPKLLILDEPTVGVDIKARNEIWSILEKLQAQGLTLIWATADCEEAQRCQNVMFMDQGSLVLQSTPQDCVQIVQNQIYHQEVHFLQNPNWRKTFLVASAQPFFQSLIVNTKGLRACRKKDSHLPISDATVWSPVPACFEDAFISLYIKTKPASSQSFTSSSEILDLEEQDGAQERLLQVDSLCKTYGSFVAVQPLSFSLHKGEILGLLGPNGCGKSTTFKMLCGLLVPTKGKATLWGVDVSQRQAHSIHQRIGYMPQKFALYKPLSVHQNLSFFAGLYGLTKQAAKNRIAYLLETLDLMAYENSVVENLPLGLIQKVSFACALVHSPEILFLDEPTSGVDPIARQEFWKMLLAVNATGVSIIVTTHFLEEAQYCHKILLMNQGFKMALGEPLKLLADVQSQMPQTQTMGDLFLWYLNQPLAMQL